MSSIQDNTIRIGRFTSSEIWRLMTEPTAAAKKQGEIFGAQAKSYIHEKNLERKLGRALGLNKGNNSTAWGLFLEQYVHDQLPLDYELMSQVTMEHPQYGAFWVGSQDNVVRKDEVVCDTKCYEPQNFCEYNDVLAECKAKNDVTLWREEYPKEYFQLCSNAAIWGYNKIEVILFMPYESQLDDIRSKSASYEGADQWKYRFIYENAKNELPYLPDNNPYYKNLNLYRFEVNQDDVKRLTERVILASSLLLKTEN